MKISKFINITPRENIFHSNDIAKVASGSTLGSASAETFRRRAHIDRGRQAVRRYSESMIGLGHMKEVARPQLDASNPLRRPAPRMGGRQQPNAIGIPPRTFKEPPARPYNPYS